MLEMKDKSTINLSVSDFKILIASHMIEKEDKTKLDSNVNYKIAYLEFKMKYSDIMKIYQKNFYVDGMESIDAYIMIERVYALQQKILNKG